MAESMRSQVPAGPEATFPPGGGELGRLIRAMDWSTTPLGPIEAWSPTLRTAVNIVVQSPLSMALLWGPDGVMIYNDAYSELARQRHPRALGCKVLDAWPEVADFNAQVLRAGLAGRAQSFRDQKMVLHRNGAPETVWMDLNYAPVLDEGGAAVGVLAVVAETTERVQTERREALLFALGERVRESNDEIEIITISEQMLGEHLEADRVHWAQINEAAGTFTVTTEWRVKDMPSLVGTHPLVDFGPEHQPRLRQGQVVAIDDTDAEPLITRTTVAEAFGPWVKALVFWPLIREGAWRSVLCVHTRNPRRWRDEDRELVRDIGARVFVAGRRATAEQRVRRSEARFRALVNATSDAIYRMSPDWTELRQLEGRGFLTNHEGGVPSLEQYLYPEDAPLVMEAIQEAIAGKRPFQLEHRVRRADGTEGWTFSRAVPLFGVDGEIIEWFGAASDVTARKQAEEHLSLVVNELNHRVKNNLAMTQALAAQTFRNADDLGRAQADFEARILALAQANDLLTGERWVGAALRGVVEQALQPHARPGERRLVVEGPDLELSPKTALSLSLALHELATNAVKYGAWSVPEGRVTVEWSVHVDPVGEHLHLEWRETEGPHVEQPARRGFGSRLIERGLAAEMGGVVLLKFNPDGLVCVVDAPLRSDSRR